MMFDPTSSTWLAFEAELKIEKQDLLTLLATENLEERNSDVIRGKIVLIDYILDELKGNLTRKEE